jgi:hypothetical protein
MLVSRSGMPGPYAAEVGETVAMHSPAVIIA